MYFRTNLPGISVWKINLLQELQLWDPAPLNSFWLDGLAAILYLRNRHSSERTILFIFSSRLNCPLLMFALFISLSFSDANLGLNGTMKAASKASKVCAGNGDYYGEKDDCVTEAGGNGLYYALFILGMVVMGCGCTPMYALGIPYMDENVKAKVSPMYVGIFAASGIVGK